MDSSSTTKLGLVALRRERVRAGTLCLHLQGVAERLLTTVDTARSERRNVLTKSVDEEEAVARDVGEAAAALHDLHARLVAEELALRQSELSLHG